MIEGAVSDYDGHIKFYPINQQETITSWKDGNPGASSIFKSNGSYTVEKYVQDEIEMNCHRLDTLSNSCKVYVFLCSKSKILIISNIISSCSFLYNSLFNRIPVIYLNHLIFKYIIYNFLIYVFSLMAFYVILFLPSNCKRVENNSYNFQVLLCL